MKKNKFVIICMISVVSVFVTIYAFMQNSTILLNIFQPSDLFKPVVEINIQDNDLSKVNTFQINHKYVGNYLVGMYFEHPSPYGTPVESCGTLKLSLTNSDNTQFVRDFSDWRDRFGGPGPGRAGVILGAYRVPENIGRGENLNAEIFFKMEGTCLKKYGTLTFFIKRGSDF